MNPEFSNSGEMVCSSLRGYRSWNLNITPQIILGSVGMTDMSWPSSELVARCCTPFRHTTDELAPKFDCKCGIYGWYEPGWVHIRHPGSVMGVVECSGRIIMGTKGFRAEKARIVAITMGSRISNDAINQIQKSISIIDSIHDHVRIKDDFYDLNYMEIKNTLEEHYMKIVGGGSLFHRIADKYDVEYIEDENELIERYPPQIDTVKNVIGEKLESVIGEKLERYK